MPNYFEIIVKKLIEYGFYDYLFPFIITTALFYALLKKSQIFAGNEVLNAVLALSISFLIFGFPILVGLTLGTQLSSFFMQATVWILIFALAIMLASFFYPSIPAKFGEIIKSPLALWAMIGLAVALFITSGLVGVFWEKLTPTTEEGKAGTAPRDVLLIVSAIIIFVVLIIIAAVTMRGT